MLKWTVKKRIEDQQQIYQFNGDSNESYNRLYKPSNNRRSLGNVLSERSPNVASPIVGDSKYNKRRSLGSQLINNRMKFDKENQVTSTPINKRSNSHNYLNSKVTSTPLTSCSNVHRNNSNKRKRETISKAISSPTSTNINQMPIYAPTLPSFDIEYSPVMKQTTEHLLTIQKTVLPDLFYEQPRYFASNLDEMPSKRKKTTPLDFSYEFKPEMASASSPLSTPLTTRRTHLGGHALLDHSTSTNSLNSSDVGDVTLEKMIDAILASAKNGKKFKKTIKTKPINNNFMKTLNEVCEQSMEQKNIKSSLNHDQTIILIDNKLENVNEREVKSPIKNCDSINEEIEMEEKCLLKRQKGVRRKNNSNENKLKKKTGDETDKLERDRDIQSCSTQKCLSFSSVNDVDLSEKSKRSSVASNSSTSLNSLTSISKYTKNLLVKGSLEMTITTDESQKKIIVHVIKCKNLFRTSETQQINAYVKCALVSGNPQPINQNIYQRTAVHKNSISPLFDHKFSFDVNEFNDCTKRIQLAVWHRNKELKKSEFLGCLSIPVRNIVDKSMQGSFLLQPQICLTNPTTVIPVLDEKIEEVSDEVPEIINDNLLLKFLELDPLKGVNNPRGRTPFTLTRTINKTSRQSFGFTIGWTNPPKIEKIEPNSPAEQNDLLPGDYIIFVGDENIVTLSEINILELIMRQENNLTFEIFRPTKQMNSNFIIEKFASLNTPIRNTSDLLPQENQHPIRSLNIDDTPKRRTINAKICFQPTIGNGVIV